MIKWRVKSVNVNTFSACVFASLCAAVVQCEIGELVCESSCIPHSKRCDHTVDCPTFNSDESSCYGKTQSDFFFFFFSQAKHCESVIQYTCIYSKGMFV